MEGLGVWPTVAIVSKVGDVSQKLGILDKYQKLKKTYPPQNGNTDTSKESEIKLDQSISMNLVLLASVNEDKFGKEHDSSGFYDNGGKSLDEVDHTRLLKFV